MDDQFKTPDGLDYREAYPKRLFETKKGWEKRLLKNKERDDRWGKRIEGIAGFLTKEVPPDAEPMKPVSFPYKGVVVTYRMNPKTNAGGLFDLFQTLAAASAAEPGEPRNLVEQKLKALIDADPNINFEDYAEELGIVILKVHRRDRRNPTWNIGQGSTYRPPE
jgi:hypothetical protein